MPRKTVKPSPARGSPARRIPHTSKVQTVNSPAPTTTRKSVFTTCKEAEQYARTWYYPGDPADVVLGVEDYRVNKIGVPGKDGPQGVYVVRAVSQSQRNQGGSGTIGWCVIWPNGYALQDYEIPGELSY